MARKKAPIRTADAPPRTATAAPERRLRTGPDWRWRTFPVFAALVTGMLIAFIVNEGSVNPVAFFLQLAAVLGVGYCLAHIVVTNVIIGGRARRRAAALDRGEPPEDDLEDVVVYPQDGPRER